MSTTHHDFIQLKQPPPNIEPLISPKKAITEPDGSNITQNFKKKEKLINMALSQKKIPKDILSPDSNCLNSDFNKFQKLSIANNSSCIAIALSIPDHLINYYYKYLTENEALWKDGSPYRCLMESNFINYRAIKRKQILRQQVVMRDRRVGKPFPTLLIGVEKKRIVNKSDGELTISDEMVVKDPGNVSVSDSDGDSIILQTKEDKTKNMKLIIEKGKTFCEKAKKTSVMKFTRLSDPAILNAFPQSKSNFYCCYCKKNQFQAVLSFQEEKMILIGILSQLRKALILVKVN